MRFPKPVQEPHELYVAVLIEPNVVRSTLLTIEARSGMVVE
jgi:hypothetical protein